MPKKKAKLSQSDRHDRKKQNTDDAAFYLDCLTVFVEVFWSMLVTIAIPLWHLIRFLVYEAWIDRNHHK